MTVKELYHYEREAGKITVSTEKPECDYTVKYRLIADEGKELTKDGENFTTCIDVDNTEGWYEVYTYNKESKPTLDPDEISPEEFMTLIEETL